MTTEKESIEDTPRTNECEAISYGYHDGFAFRFARQLERELNELQRKYDGVLSFLKKMDEMFEMIEK
jgi:hypothetical protein